MFSPAVRTRLPTLETGQLMVRPPHFTQPIFVRSPRPAVCRGRDGMERWAPAEEPGFDMALLRALQPPDDTQSMHWARDLVALHGEDEVMRVPDDEPYGP